MAAAVMERTGYPLHPASLLHSGKVDPALLDDEPAQLWERATKRALQEGERHFGVVPYFFGPSGAFVRYMPERISKLQERYPDLEVHFAPPLFWNESDFCIAEMLAERVRDTAQTRGWDRPKVLLVDHGSPLRSVTEVRNAVARQLAQRLGDWAACVGAASMERREGEAYDFNEPLLATSLRQAPFSSGQVIAALLFLAEGRHAGPGGDIAEICAEAVREQSGLTVAMTEPLGTHPRMPDLVARRMEQVLGEAGCSSHESRHDHRE